MQCLCVFPEFELEHKSISAIGVRAVMDGGHIYMFGGFLGDALGLLSRLSLPEDICGIFSHSECVGTVGCHVCGNATSGECFTAGKLSRRPQKYVPMTFFYFFFCLIGQSIHSIVNVYSMLVHLIVKALRCIETAREIQHMVRV
jgi:hypothetical protein